MAKEITRKSYPKFTGGSTDETYSPRLQTALLAVCVLIVICLSTTNADLIADNKKLSSDLISIQKSDTEISLANDALNSMIDKQAQQISNLEKTISNLEAKNASQAEGVSELNKQMVALQASKPVEITLFLENEEHETYAVSWWAFATPASTYRDNLPTNSISITDPLVGIELYFPHPENIDYITSLRKDFLVPSDGKFQIDLDISEVGGYEFFHTFAIRYADEDQKIQYLNFQVQAGAL